MKLRACSRLRLRFSALLPAPIFEAAAAAAAAATISRLLLSRGCHHIDDDPPQRAVHDGPSDRVPWHTS